MRINLTNVRLSFPVLWTPEEYQPGDKKPRYSATFLVDPGSDNDTTIQSAIRAAASETWGAKADVMLEAFKGNSGKFCYLNGNTRTYDGYAGKLYLSAHRRAPDGAPSVLGPDIDPDTGKLRVLKEADGLPYAGCYVNALVEIYGQTGQNPGIRCGLIGLQFARHGDAFSGAGRAGDSDFAPLDEGIGAGALGSMASSPAAAAGASLA